MMLIRLIRLQLVHRLLNGPSGVLIRHAVLLVVMELNHGREHVQLKVNVRDRHLKQLLAIKVIVLNGLSGALILHAVLLVAMELNYGREHVLLKVNVRDHHPSQLLAMTVIVLVWPKEMVTDQAVSLILDTVIWVNSIALILLISMIVMPRGPTFTKTTLDWFLTTMLVSTPIQLSCQKNSLVTHILKSLKV